MESVLDDCLAQFSSKYVLKKRAAPSCLGFTGANAGLVVAVLTTCFGKILIYQLFAAVKLKQREKECSISCIAIADVINDQVEAMVFLNHFISKYKLFTEL